MFNDFAGQRGWINMCINNGPVFIAQMTVGGNAQSIVLQSFASRISHICISYCICICNTIISVFNSPLFMSKYEWGDIFRRIDLSGQQDPVAKWDPVEQWRSIVVCAKRNTIVRDYEIQEIYLPLTIVLVFSKRNKMSGDWSWGHTKNNLTK